MGTVIRVFALVLAVAAIAVTSSGCPRTNFAQTSPVVQSESK